MNFFKHMAEMLKSKNAETTTQAPASKQAIATSEKVVPAATELAATAQTISTVKSRIAEDSVIVGITLSSGDYGWEVTQDCPKILLSNTNECIANPNITTWNLMSVFRETGHVEWECVLAMIFMQALADAEEHGKEADITDLFNRDLYARGDRKFTSSQIARHMERWFETVKCADGVGYLRFVGA